MAKLLIQARQRQLSVDRLLIWGGALLLWEFAVRVAHTPVWLLPAPTRIMETLLSSAPLLWIHLQWTLLESIVGLLLAIVVSLTVATAMDTWPRVKNVLSPLLAISQTIPIIALAPLLLIWLGYGVQTKIAVVVLICFFPLVTNLMDGFARTPIAYQTLFNSLGASRFQTYRHLKLSAALPYFFSGLRIATTYAVIGAVFAEWLGAEYGLGIYLFRSAKSFATPQVFAAIVLMAVVTLALLGLVNYLARRMMSWHYLSKENA